MRPEKIFEEPSQVVFHEWAIARGKNWCAEMEFVYGPPECGRHRAVFRAGDYVIKIPLCSYGVSDNESEASENDPTLAQCHVVQDSDAFPILIMERVIMVDIWTTSLPDWTDFVDSRQVGRSLKNGSIVAYDFGIN